MRSRVSGSGFWETPLPARRLPHPCLHVRRTGHFFLVEPNRSNSSLQRVCARVSLLRQHGTHCTVKARFWHWRSGSLYVSDCVGVHGRVTRAVGVGGHELDPVPPHEDALRCGEGHIERLPDGDRTCVLPILSQYYHSFRSMHNRILHMR